MREGEESAWATPWVAPSTTKHERRRTAAKERRRQTPAAPPVPIEAETGQRRPWLVVGLAIAFNLWVLRAEALPVLQLNDSSVHLSIVRWAVERLREGHLTLDGWYAYLGFGSSLPHHYQSLSHTLAAYLSLLFGTERTFAGLLYLLLATWPLSVYWGARLLGWDRWPAAAAAMISPLLLSTPGYGYEHGSYTWRGLGVWSQLWAMWLLPLAWGVSWQAVSGTTKRSLGVAALLVGITTACHFLTGYLALLGLGVWVLIAPGAFWRRLGRAAVVGFGALLIIAWVVVPLLLDARWTAQSQFLRGTFWFDSFGARRVLGWLLTGQLFDGHRVPVISLLFAVGVVVCVARFREDERGRAVLGVFVLSLLLFFGRPTLGPLLRLIPGSTDLLLHRYIMGVQLSGVLIAGVGAAWLGGALYAWVRRRTPTLKSVVAGTAVVALGVILLAPAWLERWSFDTADGRWIHEQRAIDATDGSAIKTLVQEAEARGPGRFYAGSSANWGVNYKLWSVPMYAVLLASQVDTVGFYLRTTSLPSDIEARFDETDPAQYDLFDIRYMILPDGHTPPVPATLVDSQNGNDLYEVATSGFLKLVDTATTVAADRTDLGMRLAPFLGSRALPKGLFPTVAFAGSPAAVPTVGETGAPIPRGSPGVIQVEYDGLADGEVAAQVDTSRPTMVMLKASFDPRWEVEVDGQRVRPQMVAPGFVGRTVSAGHHSVTFRYAPFPRYDLLFSIGLFVFLGLHFGPRWLARRRTRKAPSKEADDAPVV